MHIPDNYLSPSTCATFGVVMLPIWRRASIKVKTEITRQKMPLLGVAAAFSFLIMMFNIPLPGGTTGHAIGAALVAILLGPYCAVFTVTIALTIQALFFGKQNGADWRENSSRQFRQGFQRERRSHCF